MEIYIGMGEQGSVIVVLSRYCGASSQKLTIATIPELALYTN
jgi:hypothetical protein